MSIRPFDWRDLPILHRYRSQCLFLDSTLVLTRGPALIPVGALLSYLASATGVFTYFFTDEDHPNLPLLGQVAHTAGQPSARMCFLAPEPALGQVDLTVLFDQMAVEIGKRGAYHILAEVDEGNEAFEKLRQAGFGIYARQRTWKLPSLPNDPGTMNNWRPVTGRDEPGLRSLYNNLIPGLVQQVEPPPSSRTSGSVYYRDGDLLAYIELEYGLYGIWAQPFVHPNAEGVTEYLVQLLQSLSYRRSRPVYVCIRTYQSWLEATLEELGGQPGARQAIMVRHLAISRRVAQSFALPALNGKTPEPTAPIARFENSD